MSGWAQIEGALQRGASVIAGNARAARRLHLRHARSQQTAGREAWTTPSIADWKSWLRQLWTEWSFDSADAPLLLSALQEARLWRGVQGEDAGQVVSADSLAALAQQAYARLCAYEARVSLSSAWLETDAEHFRQWALRFDRVCDRRGWLSESRMEERLAQAAEAGELRLPAELVLTGFDRRTPAQNALLRALEECGIQVREAEWDAEAASLAVACAASERMEIEGCAQWLRERLKANPEARLAVLCTQVEQRRGAIDRVFRSVLTPESQSILTTRTEGRVYEFTLGRPLAQQPVTRAALLALRWLRHPLAQAEASWLLLSGFLCGSPEERMVCAQADAALREQQSVAPVVDLKQMLATAARYRLPDAVRERLQAGMQFAVTHGFGQQRRMPGAWSELARLALGVMGWPGGEEADSVKYQTQQRWEKVLEEVARLDLLEAAMSFEEFLSVLERQAMETLFAPESLDAPVQVMGPMEAAGQEFDGVWFLGVTDAQWPVSGRPHPLLPLAVQRQAGMPHAERDDDWQLARRVTERLLHSASEVICSYARHNSDGELRLSSLIAARAGREFVIDTVSSQAAAKLEAYEDTRLVPFDGGAAPGGAALLKDQAACPFRAFASHRLRAKELNENTWGLDALQRGNLLHEVLRRFWTEAEPRRIEGLDALRQTMADGQLGEVLRIHTENAFAPLMQLAGEDRWMRAYLQAEQQRLQLRLEEWLRYESRRRPFVVEACEKSLPRVQVGALELRLKIDRIDRLEDGSHLLMDYKTGDVEPKAWEGERPDEPQLPLYAVHGGVEDVSGVLFAKIRAGEIQFAGHVRDAAGQLFASKEDCGNSLKVPYEDAMQDGWQRAIAALAGEFARGDAAVRPTHGEQTCRYCPLPGLCRIHERSALDASLLDDANGEGDEGDD
jgi:ATP-dependent helicase/nuclease subunit B